MGLKQLQKLSIILSGYELSFGSKIRNIPSRQELEDYHNQNFNKIYPKISIDSQYIEDDILHLIKTSKLSETESKIFFSRYMPNDKYPLRTLDSIGKKPDQYNFTKELSRERVRQYER